MEKVRNITNKIFHFLGKYRFYMIPLFLIIVVSPLVMKYNYYELTSLENAPTMGVSVFEESFETKATMIFAKYVWFAMAIIAALYTAFNFKKMKFRWIYIPVIIYTIMVSLSAIFSDYKDVVTQGYRLHMSIFMLLGLFVSFWYCACFLKDKTDVKIVTLFAFLLIALENALGWFEKKYGEIALFPFMKRIILGKKLYNSGFNYSYDTFGGELSFDNVDYAGHFLSFVVPFLIAYAFFTNKLWKSIVALALAASSMYFVLVGGIMSAIFVCIAMIPVIIILGANRFVKKYYITVPLLVIAIIGINLIFNKWDAQIEAGEIQNYPYAKYVDDLKNIGNSKTQEKHPMEVKLEETGFHFNTEGDNLIFDYHNHRVFLTYGLGDEEFEMSFTDENGNDYDVAADGQTIYFVDSELSGIRLYWKLVDEFPMVDLICDGIGRYTFCLTDKGMRAMSSSGIAVSVEDEDSLLDPVYYELANGRGYIWSFMIPSIKNKWLLGYGPNCAFAANQANTFRGLIYHSASASINPHNMFIQIAVETGVPSLIAFVVLVGWFVIKNWKTYCYRKNVRNGAFAFSVMAGIAGYCVCGIANDMISTSFPYIMTLLAAAVVITCNDQDDTKEEKLTEKKEKLKRRVRS